ncbi:hypothetical protein RUND412_002421 [Rhizina undulata]
MATTRPANRPIPITSTAPTATPSAANASAASNASAAQNVPVTTTVLKAHTASAGTEMMLERFLEQAPKEDAVAAYANMFAAAGEKK